MRYLLAMCFVLPANAAGELSADQIEVARLVKRAERAGYERHDPKGWWRVMAKDVKRAVGRTEKAGPYDLVLDAKRLRALNAARWRRAPTSKSRIYFAGDAVTITGDTAVYTTEATWNFFGGSETTKRRYTLRRVKAKKKGRPGWEVTDIRWWWVSEVTIGVEDAFTEAFWTDADRRVAELDAQQVVSLEEKLVALVAARRFQEAYDAAVAEAKTDPKSVEAWMAQAKIGAEMGLIPEARKAFARARALDRRARLPFLLEK